MLNNEYFLVGHGQINTLFIVKNRILRNDMAASYYAAFTLNRALS